MNQQQLNHPVLRWFANPEKSGPPPRGFLSYLVTLSFSEKSSPTDRMLGLTQLKTVLGCEYWNIASQEERNGALSAAISGLEVVGNDHSGFTLF